MFKLVVMQALFALLACAVGVLVAGLNGAVSAGLAGLTCLLPSLLLASHLRIAQKRTGSVQAMRLLLGEVLKIVLTIALLVSLPWVYPALVWSAVVAGLIVTLQANFLVFLVKP